MQLPKIGLLEVTYIAGLLIMISYIAIVQNDNMQKANQINNMTAELKQYNITRNFISDYKQYTEICNTILRNKVPPLESRCTELGYTFVNYYVGFPSPDYIILCNKPEGGSQILRFR